MKTTSKQLTSKQLRRFWQHAMFFNCLSGRLMRDLADVCREADRRKICLWE
jgi:uncharacterized protein YjaG (DUF416 family)